MNPMVAEIITRDVTLMCTFSQAMKNYDLETARAILLQNSDYLSIPENIDKLRILLTDAVKCDSSYEIIKLLLSFRKFESNEQDLIIAILRDDALLVESLLKNGVKLDSVQFLTESPALFLFNISKKSNNNLAEIVFLLTQYGLDTSVQNELNQTLLHQCCRDYMNNKNFDIVRTAEILLNSGTLVNGIDMFGNTPLFYSIYSGNIQLVELLIEKGANLSLENQIHTSALHRAARTANEDIIELLVLKGAEINARDAYGSTALHCACMYQQKEKVISVLLRMGADVNSLNKQNMTPFSLLNSDKDEFDKCRIAIIKEFSKLVCQNLSILESDMVLLQASPKATEYFTDCKKELNQMANIKFYGSYSYYSVMNMSGNLKKLAYLTKNEEFLNEFEANLHSFTYYESDLKRIMEEADQLRIKLEEVNQRLNSVFKDVFPCMVIRILSENLALEDLPLH